jgi:sulfate-transporting ATPase
VQDRLDALNAWDLDSRLELAMDALRCPPGEIRRSRCFRAASGGAWRCAGCCLRSRTSSCWTSRPTISTRNRWRGWSSICSEYKGTVIAVTHDRYFLDNVAGWILELDRGYGIPWKGNYSSWLEQKQQRLAQEEKQEALRQKTLQRELEWLHDVAQGAPDQAQVAHQRLQ